MRTILTISVLALAMLGCAGKGVSPSNGGTNSPNMASKGMCDRLLNLPSEDGLLLKELVGGVEYLDENDNLIGRCECVSIVNCDEMVYCSKEECPWGTFSSLDSIINSGL